MPISTKEGDFDYERAKKGGLDAPFMSIYIPAKYQLLPDKGKALADSLINMIRGIADAHPTSSPWPAHPPISRPTPKRAKYRCPWAWKTAPP